MTTQARRARQAEKLLAAEATLPDKILNNARTLSEAEYVVLGDWAWRASKWLLSDGPDELDDLSVAVLRRCGVEPRDHKTWWLHRSGCPAGEVK